MAGKLQETRSKKSAKKGRLGRPEKRAARERADWVSFNPAAPP
ncbi:hypothetical protein [Bradyrhizobium sp. Arg816]|nr:hypothetical protein [Bradyrhizobium sp. Arg816]MDI3564128.1 hypothetical protein [Bradyrhizobium sp. Arg816]